RIQYPYAQRQRWKFEILQVNHQKWLIEPALLIKQISSLVQEGLMDTTTAYLSDYANGLTYEKLSPEAIHQVKRTLIDTLGCGVGAFDAETPSIARRIASRVQGNPPARIIGTRQESSMDLAAFANTSLIRYLD